MRFLRNRLLGRLGPMGRIADVALVGSFALRFAQRNGWISDEQVASWGLGSLTEKSVGAGELGLAALAAFRILRGRRRR